MLEKPRMQLLQMAPNAMRHLIDLERLIADKVDPSTLHLVKLRVSQINGCAFCLAMHTQEALAGHERPERLIGLAAWHDAPLYSDAERAALTWAEEITLISDRGASQAAYDGLKAFFSDEEIGWLTLAATSMNSMNRLAISSRSRFDSAAAEDLKQMLAQAG